MVNFEENENVLPEIEQELALIAEEAESLENDLMSFKSVHEELISLRQQNTQLNERLDATEKNQETIIQDFRDVIQKRDEALKILLREVKNLHAKMKDIHNVIKPNS